MNGLVRTAVAYASAALAFAGGGRALASPNAAVADAAPAATRSSSPVKRFVLVVGSNRPPRPGLATLRYADDDAVRWTVLFRTFGAEVEMLTDLDAESERLYGTDAPPHRSPTHAEVKRAMARLRGEIDHARAEGLRTAFYFIYAGHGDEENGEGFVGLADGRLLRREIEDEILAVSGADTNHVIIDACRSYYIVYDRGPGGTRRPWPEPYFTTGTAARFRNTGFVLASSSGGTTHEWEEFQAAFFHTKFDRGCSAVPMQTATGR
ncbi:MAG TPA: caspase family protein [Polyangia bacterium]|nr:caspase family protein [Polyangia bacterium]